MLAVQIPPSYEKERKYVLSVLLEEFLGLETQVELTSRQDLLISADDGRQLVLADRLFAVQQDMWLKEASLPRRPLKTFDFSLAGLDARLVSPRIPVIFGRDPGDPGFFSVSSDRIELGLDLFGSAFFMLTRYEEAVKRDRDAHGRFPSAGSLAFQEGFLDRPLVNEYVEILWACIKRLWPAMERKARSFRVLPSHDVDSPLYFSFFPKREILQGIAGDILKRKSPSTAWRKLNLWRRVNAGKEPDPFDTFDWIMNESEEAGWVSSFNLMSGGTTKFDGPGYPLDHPAVQNLVQKTAARRHRIGFHPSYRTATEEARWNAELERLRAQAEGVDIRGGRQHYLRFEVPTTWRFWDGAGLEYDSTLMYADHAGFRCGTCYEFSVFDLHRRQHLKLKEVPTIVMDSTVASERYMGLGVGSDAYEFVSGLKEHCRLFNGDFTLLWHNNLLSDPESREFYRSMLK